MFPGPCSIAPLDRFASPASSIQEPSLWLFRANCRHARVWTQFQPLACSCTSFLFTDFVVPPPASHRCPPLVVVKNIRTAPPVRFHRGTLDLANPWRRGQQDVVALVSTNLSTTRQALAGHDLSCQCSAVDLPEPPSADRI